MLTSVCRDPREILRIRQFARINLSLAMVFQTDADSQTGADILKDGHVGAAIRRRWERLPIAIPIFVRGEEENGKTFVEFSAATNLNAGGMMLVSRRRFSPGQKILLEIPRPSPQMNPAGQNPRNNFSATVLYTEYSEGFHLCGVQFCESMLPESDVPE